MRKGTRKSRAFGSFEGVLEGRSPVSTLVPGISPSFAPLSRAVDVMAIGANGSVVASRPGPAPAIPLRRPFVLTTTATAKYVTSATDWMTVTSTHADQGSGNMPKDDGNSIALAMAYPISSPAVPPVYHAVASPATPGGVAGVAMTSPSSITPAAPTPTTPDSLAPVMISPGMADSQGAIRVLSLAPPTTGGGGFHPMAGSGGGSGGYPVPDEKAPTILGSAGLQTVEQESNNGVPVPGKFKIANPVPVGTITSFKVSGSGDGYTIDSRSVIWTGGTPYSSYPLDDPNLPPPTAASVAQNVDSNSLMYSFIIDAEPRDYVIDVGVGYTNGAHGFAKLKFSSQKPPYTFTVAQKGNVSSAFSTDAAGKLVAITLGELRSADGTTDMSTRLLAKTGPAPSGSFAGSFMFLQKIDSTTIIVTNDGTLAGKPFTQSTGGLVIDDGFKSGGSPKPMGQPTVEGFRTWACDADITQGTFTDTPSFKHQSVKDGLQTDEALHDKSLTFNNSFETYLMYRPSNGAWIALSEYTWNFQIKQENVRYGFADFSWINRVLVRPDPVQSTPSGIAAFPSWTADANAADFKP